MVAMLLGGRYYPRGLLLRDLLLTVTEIKLASLTVGSIKELEQQQDSSDD